jgi:hypothetical protein
MPRRVGSPIALNASSWRYLANYLNIPSLISKGCGFLVALHGWRPCISSGCLPILFCDCGRVAPTRGGAVLRACAVGSPRCYCPYAGRGFWESRFVLRLRACRGIDVCNAPTRGGAVPIERWCLRLSSASSCAGPNSERVTDVTSFAAASPFFRHGPAVGPTSSGSGKAFERTGDFRRLGIKDLVILSVQLSSPAPSLFGREKGF